MFSICQKAIINVFQNDESGESSLDAVRLLSKMIKSREYAVHPEVIIFMKGFLFPLLFIVTPTDVLCLWKVLNTFLHLRLKDELSAAKDDSNDVARNKKKRKGDKVHLSRKMRKLAKERKLIEKEMKEADAIVDKEEKEKTVSSHSMFYSVLYEISHELTTS